MSHTPPPLIVDIHDWDIHNCTTGVREQIIEGLSKPSGEKSLPTLLLYDERGLRIYDSITTDCPEYYLFGAEEEILKKHSDALMRTMHAQGFGQSFMSKSVVLELGAGALRKTSHILLALSKLVPEHEAAHDGLVYYALDLERAELERTLGKLLATHGRALDGKVEVRGLWGTYTGGLKFIESAGLGTLSGDDLFLSIDDNRQSDQMPQQIIVRRNSSHSSASDTASHRTLNSQSTYLTPPSSPDSESDTRIPDAASFPFHILFLGSSLGNFDRKSSVQFLRSLPLRPGTGDTLLLGLDHDNEKEKIELAYNDTKGITREFIMNGLRAAGKTLGDEGLYMREKWEYFNRYNAEERRHEAYYKSLCDQTLTIPGTDKVVSFDAEELINVEVSLKYSDEDAYSLFTSANLRPVMRLKDARGQYSLWLLERPKFVFPLLKNIYASKDDVDGSPFGVPRLEDFQVLWEAWDTISLGMIPRSMLFTKPIDLRHICLFYLGHIPAFLDIHLSRLLGEANTEPTHFKDIFERGIDPHVDDPSQCHPHSEVPENETDWPTLESIIDFRDRVRARLIRLYHDIDSGRRPLTRKMGRVLFMTLEHEGFHAETLLYMLLQGAGVPGGTLQPPGFAAPAWDDLSSQWNQGFFASEPCLLGPATLSLGHDDFEAEDQDTHAIEGYEFGWDNEHPHREVEVRAFRIEWRPVSNGEFYKFWRSEGKGQVKLPASWIIEGDEMKVRTLYGPVAMDVAHLWPVLTSYDDLSKYAQVKGGRLPTEAELRLFLDNFAIGYEGGANIGFRNWHLVPPTAGRPENGGKGHNGGVWEWTSTIFEAHEGFVASKLYPGYSADFFDGKHHVVLGGSYATMPRLAERRTLRNFYQHNYPYPWVAGRIAYDV